MCTPESLLSDLDNIAGLRQCHRCPLWRKRFPRRFSEARRNQHRWWGNRYRSRATIAAVDRLVERSRPPCSDAFASTASVSAV